MDVIHHSNPTQPSKARMSLKASVDLEEAPGPHLAEAPPKTTTQAPVGTIGDRWLRAASGLGGPPMPPPSSYPSPRAFPPTWSLFLSSRTGHGWFLVWALGHWLLSGVIPAESLAEALNKIPWA